MRDTQGKVAAQVLHQRGADRTAKHTP